MVMAEIPPEWQFRVVKVNDRLQWVWERREQGRTVEKSASSLGSLADAFANARQHGFNDAHDKYRIADEP
jgi:hypothetical protein